MRHSVFKNSAAPLCGFSFLLSSGSLFWLQWFPFLFAAHQSFLFAAILIFLQRVPCGQSYIWARVLRKYMRVCLAYVCMQRTHEKKWTPHWKKPTEQKRLQVYVAKELQVYCVIILKLMADHTKSVACLQSKSTGD